MSDWVDDGETTDVKTWKDEARMFQQNMFHRLGDREWDEWDKSDLDILYFKVGFGLYPKPENLPERNTLTQYKEEQYKNIKAIADAILENSESGRNIHFACIFVFGKIGEKRFYIPVFKVKGKHNQTLFIDSDCHIYKNWKNYLNFNHLPKCLYCYPRDGLYQGDKNQVLVDFGKSPAYDPKNKIFAIDSTATMMNFASTSEMMDSLFTVKIATPIKEAIKLTSESNEACYSQSVDQQLHVQSSDDFVAQMDRLRIKDNALKDIESIMRKNIAQAAAAGEVATVEEEMAYNVANLVSLTVNGLEILKNILLLIDKKEEGTLTESDDLYFEKFVLFFTNNLLPANTARKVMEDAQQEVLNRHCDILTPSQIHELFKLSEFSQGETRLQKNANNIKAISHIHDHHTFYESLVSLKGDLEGHPVGFSSVGPGLININNELHIAPNKLVQISSADRKQILDATKKVKDSSMSNKVYEEKNKKNFEGKSCRNAASEG